MAANRLLKLADYLTKETVKMDECPVCGGFIDEDGWCASCEEPFPDAEEEEE